MKKTIIISGIFWLVLMYNAVANDARLTVEPKTFTSRSGVKVQAEVGTLKVSENRENPKAATISISYIKLKGQENSAGTPLFYLEGGPGSSCTWQAENPDMLENWVPFLAQGDVVLIDQRGTGAGYQRLLYIWQKPLPDNLLVDKSAHDQHQATMNEEALPLFAERNIDLNGYTTIQNAADLDELRSALGYEQISLMGFSYGTHLGQTYMKYHGQHVKNAVLVGVEGLNHTYKLPSSMDMQFQKISLLAGRDENLATTVPDLNKLYLRVIQKLTDEPVTLKIKSPLSGESMPVKIGAYGLNLILRFDIGDASDLPVFPRLLHMIDQGDYSALQWFVQKRIGFLYGIHAMSAVMDPASGATESRKAQIQSESISSAFKDVVNPGMDSKNWPTPDLGDDFRAPLISDIPTLLLSGTLDFNTPPFQAEEVRWGLANSTHIIVNNAGHEQILTHPKASETIIRFLSGENVADVTMSQPELQFIPLAGKAKKDLWHPSLN